jgi:hypothetical protein
MTTLTRSAPQAQGLVGQDFTHGDDGRYIVTNRVGRDMWTAVSMGLKKKGDDGYAILLDGDTIRALMSEMLASARDEADDIKTEPFKWRRR